jgi:hypothetical protein
MTEKSWIARKRIIFLQRIHSGSLLHIMPFCEGKNKKPEGFVKQKQPAIFAM